MRRIAFGQRSSASLRAALELARADDRESEAAIRALLGELASGCLTPVAKVLHREVAYPWIECGMLRRFERSIARWHPTDGEP